MHSIKIYQKDKTKVMTGLNTVVDLDGRKLEGVRQVSVNIAAGGVAEITIKMIGDVEIDGQVSKDMINPPV